MRLRGTMRRLSYSGNHLYHSGCSWERGQGVAVVPHATYTRGCQEAETIHSQWMHAGADGQVVIPVLVVPHSLGGGEGDEKHGKIACMDKLDAALTSSNCVSQAIRTAMRMYNYLL